MRSDKHFSGDGGITEAGLCAPRIIPTASSSRIFLPGEVRVGRYDLIYRLGSGGMATVFVGRLPGLAGFEKMVAIKVIHQHLADSKKFVNMFLDEARMAALIHHPNVVEIYEVDHDLGLFYMVGEFVHGIDLGRLLRRMEERGELLSLKISAYISAQVCLGLHAAHETKDKDGHLLNLIHRDVSPNNILVSYSGFVKLIDFGVAWARNKLAHTESGALKGKIGYIAPEQILGQDVDRRSDVFSVGVLLYIMTTLSHPFPGKSDAERLNKIITGDMLPPSSVRTDIHPELERIILKAMATKPSERYSDTATMAEDLEVFIASLEETVKPDDLSVLLSSTFKEEKQTHENALRTYRVALNRDKNETGERELDELLSDESFRAIRSTPVPKKHSFRKSIIKVFLGLAAIVAAAMSVWLYQRVSYTNTNASQELKNIVNNQDVAVPHGQDETKEDLSKKPNTIDNSSLQLGPKTLDSSLQTSDETTDKKDKESNSLQNDQNSAEQKRRKLKHKKGGTELLHSPYS